MVRKSSFIILKRLILRQRVRAVLSVNIDLIKKILKVFAALSLLGIIFAIGYITMVISMTPIAEKMNKVNPETKKLLTAGNLEEGSTITKEALLSYLAFSESEQEPEKFLNDLKAKEKIEYFGRGFIELNEDIALPKIEDNFCEDLFCYQKKLPFQKIPRAFWKGLIGIEDSRFVHHFGIDFRSIGRALYRDIMAMSFVEGGSTITQQLVKNMFYTNKRSIIRKINEIIIAVYIEQNYPKEMILESYFNEIVWGSLQSVRIKGIAAASIFYFGKGIDFLTPYEATILISMLKGPYYYNPIKKLDRLKTRVKAVFKRLLDLNFFQSKDKLEWNDARWDDWQKSLIDREETRPYYSVWKTFNGGNHEEDFYQKFVLQDKAKELLLSIDDEIRKKHQIEAKLIISNWDGEKFQKYYQLYSNPQREQGPALEEENHQLGSILKPIVYKYLLNSKDELYDMISTEPVTLKLKSGSWSPRESHKIGVPEMEVREALQQSFNNPIIRLAQKIGFDVLEKKLKVIIPELKTPLAEYPAQLLGAVELPIKRVSEVFQNFIQSGCFADNELGNQIIKEMADPTLTTIRKVTYKKFRDVKFFGKTGTSNNGNQNWFIAFDGKSLYALWVGASGVRSTKSLKLYGSTTAFRIFQNFLNERGKTFSVFDCIEDETQQI